MTNPRPMRVVDFITSVTVQGWLIDGVDRFDWISSTGESSDYLFDTVDDALRDAEGHFGG